MKKIYEIGVNIPRITKTLETIKETVTSTMGPAGKTNILYGGDTVPHITKDGVSVAEFLKFEFPFEEAINKIVKETARNTGEKVGDGTTTSTLLACSLTSLVLERAITSTQVKRKFLKSIETDIDKVIDYIKSITVSLDNFLKDDVLSILESIINLSSNGDKEATELILDVIKQIGANGLIDVIEARGEDIIVDIQDGMLIESPAHVTKTVELTRPYVALVSSSIDKVHELKTLMQIANTLYNDKQAPLVIVAKEFSKDIQSIININNRNQKFNVILVESDGFALNALEILDDMASLLECKVLSTDKTSAFGLQNVVLESLARVKSAVITPNQTVLYNEVFLNADSLEVKTDIEEAIARLKSSGEDKIGELKQLNRRLSKYSKSAVIKVGGVTTAEKIERKDRIEDAVQAIQSAINYGIVPGGGYALYKASTLFDPFSIMAQICMEPLETLCKFSDVKVIDVKALYDDGKSIDFSTLETSNIKDYKIIDPAEVQIKSLQQAFAVLKSIAGSFALIIDTPNEV